LKILHVIYDDANNPWLGGGGSIRALEINNRLAEKNEITVLTGNFPGAKNEKLSGVAYKRTGLKTNYLISRVTYFLSLPLMIFRFKTDVIVNDFSIFSPCFCYLYSSTPVVNLFHHYIGKKVFNKFFILGFFAFVFEKIFLKTANNIITVSQSVTDLVKKRRKQALISLINNGVSEYLFNTKEEKGSYVGFLGRIDIYMKGLDHFVELAEKCKETDIKFKIAGSGPEKSVNKLIDLIAKKKMTNIEMTGKLSDDQKTEFLLKAKIIILPSRFEGWGIVAVEAAACGKPVIGFNIPGLKDAIVDGETGILVEAGNIDKLKKTLVELWNDENRCEKLGRNGRKRAENFKWDKIAAQQEEFYKMVVN